MRASAPCPWSAETGHTSSATTPNPIRQMAAEIETATTFVHVEFYILALDQTTTPFFRAMESAVQRGVAVRVLLDHVASTRSAHHRRTFAELDRIGVKWAFMLPLQPLKGKYQRPDLRGHRKLLVVDGVAAFIGSQNVIDRSYNSSKNNSPWTAMAGPHGPGHRTCGHRNQRHFPLRLVQRNR